MPRGLRLPIVDNTSADDALSALRLLDGRVDFKFWNPETALRLARAKDDPDRVREAITPRSNRVTSAPVSRSGLTIPAAGL